MSSHSLSATIADRPPSFLPPILSVIPPSLSSGSPNRIVQPIGRHSGVPQPRLALESTPPASYRSRHNVATVVRHHDVPSAPFPPPVMGKERHGEQQPGTPTGMPGRGACAKTDVVDSNVEPGVECSSSHRVVCADLPMALVLFLTCHPHRRCGWGPVVHSSGCRSGPREGATNRDIALPSKDGWSEACDSTPTPPATSLQWTRFPPPL